MRDDLMDVLDAAAKRYPIKALAAEINKAESSLRNELTQQHGYKLGLWDAVLIMKKTGDLSALDMVESIFGRVAFPIPTRQISSPVPIMRGMSKMSKEFSESISTLAETVSDGTVSISEARACIMETEDLIKACIEVNATLKSIVEAK